MELMTVKHIKKTYHQSPKSVGTEALKGVSFQVEEGEFIAIMGPSVCGKTTLLNVIAGIDSADEGQILLDGRDITAAGKEELAVLRRHWMGIVFQDFHLIESLNVQENIMVPMVLDKADAQTMLDRSYQLAKQAGIEDILDKRIYEISGGQQQRAAICRALMQNPSLLLADEPTGNLDSAAAANIMDCFRQLNQEQKRTILMVTHDASAASYCGRVLFLKDGKVIKELKKESDNDAFYQQILGELSAFRRMGA